jgi:hypothetical protein
METKANRTGIKKLIGAFHPAPWQQSGRNMRGPIWRRSLVAMEEPGTFVEAERGKNPAQYDTGEMAFKYECARSNLYS